MDQLKDDFLEFAFSVYTQYAEAYGRREGLAPALVFPLSYLAFAREETRLFQFLFVRDMALDMARPADFYKEPGNMERARAFARQVGVDPEPGKELFLDLFLYTHGMAVLTASGKMDLPAASARAMVQRLGFNTLRKHIKVEPEIFYYQCDRLGMVVFQDMVNNGDYRFVRDTLLPTLGFRRKRDVRLHRDPAARAAFLEGMEATVAQLKNHPCIFLWTVFNEGWGQFDSARVYARLKELDPDRFVDTASGWFLPAATDVDSRHIYFGPWRLRPGDNPLLLTEFGGACLAVEGHLYHPDKSYGYSTCKDRAALEQRLRALYEKRVLPAARKGLCGAIYTQLSDVEDEINGLVTWDRRVVKVEPDFLRELAHRLEEAVDR